MLTDRLVLKELASTDALELFEIRGDAEAMAFWDWPPDSDPAVTTAVVERTLQEMKAGRAQFWTVRLRVERTFVGLCDLSDPGPDHSADLGFLFVRRYWGQGLAQEAVGRILDYARETGLKYISARVHNQNERSIRLLERLGFGEAAKLPHFEIRPGVFRDCRRYEQRL